MKKTVNLFSILLFSFIISYLLASAFNKYGIEVDTLFPSIIIILSTVGLVSIIDKLMPTKPKVVD
ncbi:hypothetical protein [Bacillus sp. Hm123]|uniref:hypothetical protein n=1 Tax=Bacillus sp. Hm123 TaxID=3450745 RepID=UPI003F434319